MIFRLLRSCFSLDLCVSDKNKSNVHVNDSRSRLFNSLDKHGSRTD